MRKSSIKVGLSGRTIFVAVNFVGRDPLPDQQQEREGLTGDGRVSHRLSRHPLGHRGDGGRRGLFGRFTWRGTHRGEFFGVPATERQITVKGMVVDRVVAGKMVESRILMDDLSMMTELDVIREWPSNGAAIKWVYSESSQPQTRMESP